MELQVQPKSELPTPTPIRVETALSRYPVHRLAKHGDMVIDIREKSVGGEVSILWEVNHVGKFGQPGPLAYKVDTLIINRRIEEVGRPIPRIIRLGSLSEICRELGQADSGKNTNHVKNALRQNAFTAIIAKISYRLSDGTTRTLESDFNRYSVVFTGEELPDGRKADAVYIILNDIYMQVINGAMTRPLDYDYLKILPPASQRFYELLSFQMYGTVKHNRPSAKLRYSELCTYAPLTRQYDWNVVRPQLARIHTPHRKSGYIGEINFQETVDAEGNLDWIMLYQPGPKARAEYRAFTKRGGPVMLEMEPFTPEPPPSLAPLDVIGQSSPAEHALIGRGVTATVARQLASEHPEATILLQLEILDWLSERKPDKIAEPAAYLVTAIKNGHAVPKGFVSRADRERREAERHARDRQKADDRRRKQQETAQEEAHRQAVEAHIKQLDAAQRAELEVRTLAAADPKDRANYDNPIMARYRETLMIGMLREYLSPILRGQR